MKGLISKITIVFAVLALTFSIDAIAKDSKVDLSTSITCGSCVNSIKTAFKDVDGVKDISANVETKVVTVSFDDEKITTDKIKSTITDLGYTADMKSKSCDASKASCDSKKASCDSKTAKTASAEKKCGDKEACCTKAKTADAKTK